MCEDYMQILHCFIWGRLEHLWILTPWEGSWNQSTINTKGQGEIPYPFPSFPLQHHFAKLPCLQYQQPGSWCNPPTQWRFLHIYMYLHVFSSLQFYFVCRFVCPLPPLKILNSSNTTRIPPVALLWPPTPACVLPHHPRQPSYVLHLWDLVISPMLYKWTQCGMSCSFLRYSRISWQGWTAIWPFTCWHLGPFQIEEIHK